MTEAHADLMRGLGHKKGTGGTPVLRGWMDSQ